MLSNEKINKGTLWLLGAIATILLTGWLYAVTTSWQNNERLSTIGTDLKSIKRSLIRISIKTDPSDPTIQLDLLSDSALKKGIAHFRVGEFPAAYSAWSTAAAKGDPEAAYAIFTASETIKEKLKDPSLSQAEKNSLATALQTAPHVEERNGDFILQDAKW